MNDELNRDRKIPETIKVPVYNMGGEVLEDLELPTARLGGRIYRDVLRQAVITHESNRRSGTAKAKTRAEVAYGGAKPWPQKGTGRARAGSRGSPLWVGGGVIHGPVVRDYSRKLNKKMRKRALASAILGRALDGEIRLLDALVFENPKTAEAAQVCRNLGIDRSFLIVLPEHDPLLWRCFRNIPGAAMMAARELNAYEVLRVRDVVFVGEAFEAMVKELENAGSGRGERPDAEPVQAEE